MQTYRRLLRVRHMKPLLATVLLARMPIGINGLATVLFLREETGSFAVAGAAAGALALGAGVGAPVGARLVDRFGTRVLLALAVLHAAGLLTLVGLGKAGAPSAAVVAAAFLAGMALPPSSSVMRSLYPRLLAHDPPLIQTAFALDSVLTEMLFILGPLFTAVLVATAGPAAALVLSAVVVTTGVSAFLAVLPAKDAAAETAERPSLGRLGALRSRGLRTLVITMVPVGFGLGALEIALPAFAAAHDRPELAGVLVAIWSVGSAVGGLVYGAQARTIPLAGLHVRMAVLVPLSFLPLLLATSPFVMALLAVPAGLFIAPLIATRNELAGMVAPHGAEIEAFTWPLTALVAGVSLGAAAAGGIVEAADWHAAIAAGSGAAALGAVLALWRRGTLAPSDAVAEAR
jgi:MFS family permease